MRRLRIAYVKTTDLTHGYQGSAAERLRRCNLDNVEIRRGCFPDALHAGERFDSVTTSLMLAHLTPPAGAR